MNTADRSLAMIDYALRRRFSFFSMKPGFSTEQFRKYQEDFHNETFDALIEQVETLNKEIARDDALGEGFCIGHSYFCEQKACTEEWMRSVVDYDILPMLEEYWFDDRQKVQRWENNLTGVFHD
jgi:5-methylcytosine-specific restriction protein B